MFAQSGAKVPAAPIDAILIFDVIDSGGRPLSRHLERSEAEAYVATWNLVCHENQATVKERKAFFRTS
jgi:hypothetical protein